ncbi:MAG: hypothetical protein KAG14_03390 [Mycoplasmataceae bacterium]|nr:hypothetical protein [Mycoplasmataceae bacterium]
MIKEAIFHVPEFDLDNDKNKNIYLAIGNVQSGKTRYMINKTIEALEHDYDAVIIMGGSNNNLLEQTYKRFNNQFFSTYDTFSVYPIKDVEFLELPNEKIIITSLKQQKSIDKINEILYNSIDKKILIFDDESDFGSINIASIGKQSRIYEGIHAMYSNIKRGTFVSVTATPFADITSDGSFSFDDIVRILPGEGYCGIKEFNDSNVYKTLDYSDDVREGKTTKEWLSMIAAHVNSVIKIGLDSSQMLINNHLEVSKNKVLLKKIKSILDVLIDNTKSFFPGKYESASKVLKELSSNIYMIWSGNTDWNKESHSILIGGSLVSRGYTFEKLVTTVILNAPNGKKIADTMLQRARWFGYRKNISSMNVFLSLDLLEGYKEMQILNSILFNEKNSIVDIRNTIKNSEFDYIVPTRKGDKND